MTLEAQTIARACGKSHVHNLEPEDLVALTVEAAAMARVPLAGTDWIPRSRRVAVAGRCVSSVKPGNDDDAGSCRRRGGSTASSIS